MYSQGTTYDTETLAGTLPSQENGHGAVWIPATGMQNGPTDGVALIDGGGQLVEFLSYEGAMTASNGPAAGADSIDIIVNETGTEATGLSLQRTGLGSMGSSFTWTGPVASSQGMPNAGQDFN